MRRSLWLSRSSCSFQKSSVVRLSALMVPGAYLVCFCHALDFPEGAMKRRSWAARVAILSGGVLVVAVLFLVVVRALNITIAGVEPEALVLTAMMTAPFTLGVLLLLVLGAAAAERVVRRVRA